MVPAMDAAVPVASITTVGSSAWGQRVRSVQLFGSDTPSAQLHTNPPGLNGRLEMDNWIAAGVSEAKLFRAMTIDNARVMGLDDEIGTIEPGKRANLLLLGADPLKNVKAYDAIETVFLNGRTITRETLSARQAHAARQ